MYVYSKVFIYISIFFWRFWSSRSLLWHVCMTGVDNSEGGGGKGAINNEWSLGDS